jgi:dihydrolipoamide dehydrogenase
MTDYSTDTWDLIVIGAGAVGENVADYATKGGLRTVIVEASSSAVSAPTGRACHPRRSCGPRACSSRRSASPAQAQPSRGTSTSPPCSSAAPTFTSHWDDEGQVSWLTSAKIDLVRGRGRLTGERTVDVAQPDGTVRRLTATHAVAVCTGSVPSSPPSRDWRTPDPGQAGKPPPPATCPIRSRSWGAASWQQSWRPSTAPWG